MHHTITQLYLIIQSGKVKLPGIKFHQSLRSRRIPKRRPADAPGPEIDGPTLDSSPRGGGGGNGRVFLPSSKVIGLLFCSISVTKALNITVGYFRGRYKKIIIKSGNAQHTPAVSSLFISSYFSSFGDFVFY